MNMIDILLSNIADFMATDIFVGPERQWWLNDVALANLNELKSITTSYLANLESLVNLNCEDYAEWQRLLRIYYKIESSVECLVLIGQDILEKSFMEEQAQILLEKKHLGDTLQGMQNVYNGIEQEVIRLSVELEKGMDSCKTSQAILDSGLLEKLRLENVKESSKILDLLKNMGTLESTSTPSRLQSPSDMLSSISSPRSSVS